MQRYSYHSVELARVLWRGPRQAMLEYRYLDSAPALSPGQFILFWVPGLEAIPLTPLYSDASRLVLLVVERGPTTAKLVSSPPRYAGVIAVLGRRFTYRGDEMVFLAGGVGVAAIAMAAREAAQSGVKVTVFYGARSASELAPVEDFLGSVRIIYATDDGSRGHRGTVLDALHASGLRVGDVYTVAAGPKPLLCKAYSEAAKAGQLKRLALSLETMVRCGLGFCGSCAIPCTGMLLCRDGPIVPADRLGCWVVKECQN